MVSALSTSGLRALWVEGLARDIVLCFWARHFTLTMPHHSGVEIGTGKFNSGWQPCDGPVS